MARVTKPSHVCGYGLNALVTNGQRNDSKFVMTLMFFIPMNGIRPAAGLSVEQ